MNSHLAITVLHNGKQQPLTLPSDFSIDIDDQNPMFNDNEMFSYPVKMPIEGNRFLLGNIDDKSSEMRPVALEHAKMRISVDNMPFRSGTLVTTEDEEIDGALTMNISASEHSIDDLIGTLSCRDIPVKDKIQIGEKIGDVLCKVEFKYRLVVNKSQKHGATQHGIKYPATAEATFTPNALGFSFPGVCVPPLADVPGPGRFNEIATTHHTEDYGDGNKQVYPNVVESFINVSEPYPAWKYCNARVAYYHHGIDEEGNTTDELDKIGTNTGHNKHFPYWVLDADRPQSGICFYVLYFLDCLFAYLGVSWDNSELLKVEDMKRLCFFTTRCCYDEEPKYHWGNGEEHRELKTLEDINKWLSSRGCGGQLKYPDPEGVSLQSCDFIRASDHKEFSLKVGAGNVIGITSTGEIVRHSTSARVMKMYANSENFPDESVSTILDSLYASFGIKFEYDYEKKHVRAYFMREVFRSPQEPIDFPGKVISMHKVAEKITGFRMCYSKESASKEQQANIKHGVKDYDTDYDYIDYPQKSTVTNRTYEDIFRMPRRENAASNTNVFIDRVTGNAYRIKVNGEAEKVTDLKPELFEVGTYKGVELGDCSELNEDFVQEMSSDFVPMVFNDVNYQQERNNAHGTYEDEVVDEKVYNDEDRIAGDLTYTLNPNGAQPMLVAFADVDMEHQFVEQHINYNVESGRCGINCQAVLKLVESYDPSSADEGNSPLQSYDWGNAIAIMRGGGTDATIQTYDYGYDGFNNSKWRTVAGQYALTSDSIDMWGNEYDYNGTKDGIGTGERFSLKIRAGKQPDWADAPIINDDIRDNSGKIAKKVRSRGLFDTFISDYAHFLMHRRKYIVRIACSAAQVADVPNHWTRRFRINGLVGYINKLSYSVSATDGLKDLEVEFFVV